MTEPYRVLARRYRPQAFAEVIGQDVAVRTLSRAVSTGRIAHAYLLTGIRGVGKTSLARIIAKSLCCDEGPTPTPCGRCRHCVAITEDNHPDVTEVDAASKTGVEDVRAIVDGTRYMPVDARYRVYIVDEAHMLTRGAFAALLKTLEEPPQEVVFVLATTDPQKLPVTIISRCQQYALRRVPEDVLAEYYRRICHTEGFDTLEFAAVIAIARFADGSVRDGLSMLDQAMTLEGGITEANVLSMLGVGDRGRVLDALEYALRGDAVGALTEYDDLHACGADPGTVIADLMAFVHQTTLAKLVENKSAIPSIENRVWNLAKIVSQATLARAWGMLLKGCHEVQAAPNPSVALEMLLVRLSCVAELPTAAEVIGWLEKSR